MGLLILIGWLQTLWLREHFDWETTVTGAAIGSIATSLLVGNLQSDRGIVGKACRAICRPFRLEIE